MRCTTVRFVTTFAVGRDATAGLTSGVGKAGSKGLTGEDHNQPPSPHIARAFHPQDLAAPPGVAPDHKAAAAYLAPDEHDHHAHAAAHHEAKVDAHVDHAEHVKAKAEEHAKHAPLPKPDEHGKHGEPPMDPAVATAIAQMTIISTNLMIQTQTLAAKEHARQEQEKVQHAINDVSAIGYAATLTSLAHDMNDKNSRAFINTLDKINDPDLRAKVKHQFEAQNHQTLENFIQHCDDWNNNGDNRDKSAAMQLISKERDQAEANIAKMDPDERKRKEKDANDAAITILAATKAHDHSDANMQKLFRELGKSDPERIEMIRAAVQQHTHGDTNLYQSIDDGTHKGDEDEAIAMLAGDRVASAKAAIKNEDDPARLREVMTELKGPELAKVAADPATTEALAHQKNPTDAKELLYLVSGDKADADAERLGNLLKPKGEGYIGMGDVVGMDNMDRRKASNVLKEFESMSGADVKAAALAWNKTHPDRSFEQMLQDRWGDDNDKTEYNRLLAMIHGDKGLDRSLRLQEGMREHDQEEIEGALAHTKDPNQDPDLKSSDPAVRTKAEVKRFDLLNENAMFELHNNVADQATQQVDNILHGKTGPVQGRSTKDQLGAYYDAEKAKDIGTSFEEVYVGGSAATMLHASRQLKHDNEVRDNRVGAMELLDDGKLSVETEFHRGKGAKEQAEKLESIQTNKELQEAQERFKAKYGDQDMLPATDKKRSDMNANELMIDNIRQYGVKAERPAQLEYMLQVQQYEKQYSESLEADEADEAGGGTQKWQREELAAERDMLKDPKAVTVDPQVLMSGPFKLIANATGEPTFDTAQAQIDALSAQQHLDDGLKANVTKAEFNAQDKGMTAANAAQEEGKKRLAERITKIFSTIAKIASLITMQPELILLIDVGEGLLEMGIKHQVMGEAYDPAEDAKMLAFTAAADIALMGLTKAGELKAARFAASAETKVVKAAEQEAISAGEKAAVKIEQEASGEAKAEALKEGAHAVAGESKAMQGAIEEGTSAERALSSEAAGEVGAKVEQKAVEAAEGKAAHAVESTAAKEAETGAKEMSAETAKAVEQIKSRYGLAGNFAKMGITTVGGGIVQGKSPGEILRGLTVGGLGLVLPGHLAEKVREAIGNDTLALKVLNEIASFTTETATMTTLNAAGGADGGDAVTEALWGAAGSRYQRGFGGGHGKQPAEEPREPLALPEPTPEPVPSHTTEPTPISAAPTEPAPQLAPTPEAPAPSAPNTRTTEPMPVVVPPEARVTDRMPAVAPEAANSPAQEAKQAFVDDAPTLADRIDRATGVDKGADYKPFRDDMVAFYKNQNEEARQVTHVEGQPVESKKDGGKWVGNQNYDVRRFQYDNATLTNITMDAHMAAGPGVSPEQVAAAKASTFKGVDSIVNTNENGTRHTLPDGSKLHVEPVFHDDPAMAKHRIELVTPFDPQTGKRVRTNQKTWSTADAANPNVGAHELVGHGAGFPDTYVDPESVWRDTPSSPFVTNDKGFMETVGPGAHMTQANRDQLGRDIAGGKTTTTPDVTGSPPSAPDESPTDPVATKPVDPATSSSTPAVVDEPRNQAAEIESAHQGEPTTEVEVARDGTVQAEAKPDATVQAEVERATANADRDVDPKPEQAPTRVRQDVYLMGKDGLDIGQMDVWERDPRSGPVFVEEKDGTGIGKINPKTNRPFKDPEIQRKEWVDAQIRDAGRKKATAIRDAVATRGDHNAAVPSIEEVRQANTIRFEIKADNPELRAAVEAQLDQLRAEFPAMTFDVRFGVGKD